ncbi:MAG: hypothetical protein ACRDPF_30850 [Streptosporangiaceae bacterium]
MARHEQGASFMAEVYGRLTGLGDRLPGRLSREPGADRLARLPRRIPVLTPYDLVEAVLELQRCVLASAPSFSRPDAQPGDRRTGQGTGQGSHWRDRAARSAIVAVAVTAPAGRARERRRNHEHRHDRRRHRVRTGTIRPDRGGHRRQRRHRA